MIDHIGIATGDTAALRRFHEAALGALGASECMVVQPEYTGGTVVVGYGRERSWLSEGEAGPGRHVAFAARSRDEVDAFYKAALAAGGLGNGKPGVRPQYHPAYYAAFVLDPGGNNIEAACHAPG
jgi:catechol 2,3-dioxygenase-like lactoylglutathione lyase family enzyme